MTFKDDTSPNYGSLSRDSTSSTSEEEGGDTFAASAVPGRRPPRFSLTRDPSHGTTDAPQNMRISNVYTQSMRKLFDGWLMRDYSVKGGMTSLRHLEKFIGPTVSEIYQFFVRYCLFSVLCTYLMNIFHSKHIICIRKTYDRIIMSKI